MVPGRGTAESETYVNKGAQKRLRRWGPERGEFTLVARLEMMAATIVMTLNRVKSIFAL